MHSRRAHLQRDDAEQDQQHHDDMRIISPQAVFIPPLLTPLDATQSSPPQFRSVIMQRSATALRYFRMMCAICVMCMLAISHADVLIHGNGQRSLQPLTDPFEHEEITHFFIRKPTAHDGPIGSVQQVDEKAIAPPPLPKIHFPKIADAAPTKSQTQNKSTSPNQVRRNMAMARAMPHDLPTFGKDPEQQLQMEYTSNPSWKQNRFTLRDDDEVSLYHHKEPNPASWSLTRTIIGLLILGLFIDGILQECFYQRRTTFSHRRPRQRRAHQL